MNGQRDDDRRRIAELRSELEDARRTAARFQTLVEHMPAISYSQRVDDRGAGDGEVFYVSPQTQSMLGFAPDRWADPMFWLTRVHPDDRERVLAESARTAAEGVTFVADYRFIRADGVTRWVRDHADIVTDQDGEAMWQGFTVDITEQIDAEQRFRALVEALPAATYTYEETAPDSDRYIPTYMSPQFQEIAGHPPARMLTDESALWAEIVDPRDRERVRGENAEARRTGAPMRTEYRMRTRNGVSKWIYEEEHLFRDEPGKPRGWLGVLFDVTERKAAAENLQQSFDLLRSADAERRMLLSRIVEAHEVERRRIAADIHDDPVQKMTAVSLRIDSLERHLDSAEGRQKLDALREVVSGATTRLRRLLFELHPTSLEHDGLSATLTDTLRRLREETGIETHLDDHLVTEPAQEIRAAGYRIVQEALANVRKHSGAGRVELLVETRTDGLVLRVRDDGSGFDGRAIAVAGHIGLPAMRERAEMMGGHLRMQTTPGVGTTVEAWLPNGARRVPEPA